MKRLHEWKRSYRKSKMSREKTGNIETEANELLQGNKIDVPTWVQNHVQNCVQNRVQKIIKIANKNMSFLKIIDPKKRDYSQWVS